MSPGASWKSREGRGETTIGLGRRQEREPCDGGPFGALQRLLAGLPRPRPLPAAARPSPRRAWGKAGALRPARELAAEELLALGDRLEGADGDPGLRRLMTATPGAVLQLALQ